MPCDPEVLKQVPLFSGLDDDEIAVLAGQTEMKSFAPRQRIYKLGDGGGRGYVLFSGAVRIVTIDEADGGLRLAPGQYLGHVRESDEDLHDPGRVR